MPEPPAIVDGSDARPLRFLEFELHAESGVLLRDGTPVRLAPTPLRLLRHLAARHGHVVSRQELQDAVWDGRHLAFDEALNFAVRQLRRALGDDAAAPRVIETVPRRGYRFIAPLGVWPEPAPTASRRHVLRRVAWGSVFIASAAAVLLLSRRPERLAVSLDLGAKQEGSVEGVARFDSLLRAAAVEAGWTVAQGGATQLALTANVDSMDMSGSALLRLDARRPGAPAIIWRARVRAQPSDWPRVGRDLIGDLAHDLPRLLSEEADASDTRAVMVEHAARSGAIPSRDGDSITRAPPPATLAPPH